MNIILIIFAILLHCSPSWALSIDQEHISGFQRGTGTFGWNYAYDIGVVDNTLTIGTTIQFLPTTPLDLTTKIAQWDLGIDQVWNNQYQVSNGTEYLPIAFDVDLGTSFSTADYVVNVSASPGGTNMLNWNIFDSGLVAAHEYGHMFGLFDEYSGGAQDPDHPLLDSTSIMGNLGGSPKPRHYQAFVDWIGEQTDQSWQLIAVDTSTPLHETPEPSTFFLFGSGFAVLMVLRTIKLRHRYSITHP